MIEVAVPSYGRPELVWHKTVGLLLSRGVPADWITVWVADEAERAAYRAAMPGNVQLSIAIAAPGLCQARNVIAEYYDDGTRVVHMDDDVDDIRWRVNEKAHEPLLDLVDFWSEMFAITESLGLRLWGVYPLINPMFMKPRVTTDLRLITGPMYGTVARRNDPEATHVYIPGTGEKEDRERTLRYYVADGGVVRANHVGVKTKYFRAEGGINRTMETERAAVDYLLANWPQHVKERPARKSGYPEVRLIG